MVEYFAPYWLFLVLGLANAVLYANLQPLWEGFDEPFHYAFVEHVAAHGELPVFGSTHVASDIEQSLRLAPGSAPVRANLPYVMTYSEYFALPDRERAARRDALWNMPAGEREIVRPGANMNYEAQQTPLAYLLLAPLDMLWAQEPLPVRVLRLRLFCAIVAVLVCFGAALTLAHLLEMDRAATSLMLALLVSAQMFYGATAHVANDWLSVSLAACSLVILLRYLNAPDMRGALALGVVVGLGVMAKASSLAWAAVAALVVLVMLLRRRARIAQALAFASALLAVIAPWFLRNYYLQGSFSVMQQTMRGVGAGDALHAALTLPWLETIATQLRSALWTGNSSFTTFSRSTLNVVLALVGLALAAWVATQARARRAALERWMVVALGVFALALAYAYSVFYATRPGLAHLMPWHAVAVFPPLACLVACGTRRAGNAGRWLAAGLVLGFVYLNIATYILKLIPLYGGCDVGRMKWRELHTCYVANADRTFRLLFDTALGPAWLIFALAAAVSVLALVSASVTIRRWFAQAEQP